MNQRAYPAETWFKKQLLLIHLAAVGCEGNFFCYQVLQLTHKHDTQYALALLVCVCNSTNRVECNLIPHIASALPLHTNECSWPLAFQPHLFFSIKTRRRLYAVTVLKCKLQPPASS
ncbi:hypothetical protein KC19_6G079200 [Ceratodon purpureus]|uniref:Uncharacterized protein n=1 Tax=Ceratodon purpureus TaxID=3225 RepID=A0A8T0HE94_CERPU|nr:hypothetical protein KC19_6G079200 [Ceratodon purpureus]